MKIDFRSFLLCSGSDNIGLGWGWLFIYNLIIGCIIVITLHDVLLLKANNRQSFYGKITSLLGLNISQKQQYIFIYSYHILWEGGSRHLSIKIPVYECVTYPPPPP